MKVYVQKEGGGAVINEAYIIYTASIAIITRG